MFLPCHDNHASENLIVSWHVKNSHPRFKHAIKPCIMIIQSRKREILHFRND